MQEVGRISKEITLIFVHGDGGSNHSRAREESCAPSVDVINAEYENIAAVAVVPVKEMEAWALADVAAVRAATGINYQPSKPNPESILDPKRELNNLIVQTRSITSQSILLELGTKCDLKELKRLHSFRRFEAELADQLFRIGVK
jgi:hypothetical protein